MAIPALAGFVASIVGWIGAQGWQASRQILVVGALFVALKALFLGLVTLVLPVVLYTVGSDLMVDGLQWGLSKVSQYTVNQAVISLTGLAGWLAVKCKVAECVSIVLGAAYIRLVLRFMRIV